MLKEVHITWEEILNEFKYYLEIYGLKYEELSDIRELKVNNYNRDGYFFGYDWIFNCNYEHRTDLVCNKPLDFFLFGQCLNVGTLHTVELLDKCKGNKELITAVWICAVCEAIESLKSRTWYGEKYAVMVALTNCARPIINEQEDMWYWHHSTTKQVPEIYTTDNLIEKISSIDFKALIEIIVINIKIIVSNYKMVKYDSRI